MTWLICGYVVMTLLIVLLNIEARKNRSIVKMYRNLTKEMQKTMESMKDENRKLQAELGFYKNVNPSHEPSRKEQYEN